MADLAVITASIVLPLLIGATIRHYWWNQQPRARAGKPWEDRGETKMQLPGFRGFSAEEDPTKL